MDIASEVYSRCEGASAITFAGGYAQHMMPNGRGFETVRFPIGKQEVEKRNPAGRCTLARYVYADGSRLEFRWSESRSSLRVIPANAKAGF